MQNKQNGELLWLPTTKKEVEQRGWDQLDVILFTGDAYVDHPSFGGAVIGRVLESMGLKVAIIPQPNWRDDLRDFKKLGTPRLFFGVSAGAMDSMVNRYTANKRIRSNDAYTLDGRPDMRPDYPTIVYTKALKSIYPDIPVVVGGIEASLRRFTHYDYWQDVLRPSFLIESGADMLIYGMGELPIRALVERLQAREPFHKITNVKQTAVVLSKEQLPKNQDNSSHLILASHKECVQNKVSQTANFCHIETESNKQDARTLWQPYDTGVVCVNPPFRPMTTEQVDACYDLPYTRLPHPKYRGKEIPAYEMIKHSVNIHRGCFGGCAFCTISAHQGKFIASRSTESILREVKQVVAMADFKGYLSDLGGPSANMYAMGGKRPEVCQVCTKPSCIHPSVCNNLNADHTPLLKLYETVDKIPGIKKAFVGSGIRYDLITHRDADEKINTANRHYLRQLMQHHVSGRLKVAPEHTHAEVLKMMRKPTFDTFESFNRAFDVINKELGLRQQLIPYFISSHPASTPEAMAELAVKTKQMHFQLEQVQDFTPTPMTLSTEMFYSGQNPYTGDVVYTARTQPEKLIQREFFFWYHLDHRNTVQQLLRKMNRPDLIQKLYGFIKKK